MRREITKGFGYVFIQSRYSQKRSSTIIYNIACTIIINFTNTPWVSLCCIKGVVCEFLRNQLLFCLVKKWCPFMFLKYEWLLLESESCSNKRKTKIMSRILINDYLSVLLISFFNYFFCYLFFPQYS